MFTTVEVLTAVSMKLSLLWNMMSLKINKEVCDVSKELAAFVFKIQIVGARTLELEAASSFQTSVSTNRHAIPGVESMTL
jgi:hypothetical protein